jgi:seryl-tRNA synthetase
MELNITLLVQMIHFLGAYYLIGYGIIRPYMQSLAEDERSRESLIKAIEAHKEDLLRKEQEYEQEKRACKKIFIELAPFSLPRVPTYSETSYIKPQLLSPEKVQQEVDKIAKIVVERAIDGI